MEQQTHIKLDNFDREYGLQELLPTDLAAMVINDLGKHARASIIFPDGRNYYGQAHSTKKWLADALRAINENSAPFFSSQAFHEDTVVFPLIHEMEKIGFLVLQQTGSSSRMHLEVLGSVTGKYIDRIMHLNYKNLMTSGLHGQVVEESYARLQAKASQLERSEAKYRALAKNLEAVVERKTRKIKETQLMMLQQEKLASIGQLAAGMAHEINNPIGFIISNLRTFGTSIGDLFNLLDHYGRLVGVWSRMNKVQKSSSTVLKQLENIHRLQHTLDIDFLKKDTKALLSESLEGAQRIKTIVHNLREFTHPSVETRETIDIHHCLDTTLSLLSGEMDADVRIVKDYHDIPLVCCHLRELNQVFFNILTNAIQAMGHHGQITIGTHECIDGQVEITICDTGPGIPEVHLGRIFDPFFTTRDVGGGMGLGLYLAYSTIKKHNGTIAVESKEGHGSTFRIKLPLGGS